MRSISPKRRSRMAEVKPIREALIAKRERGGCMNCGHSEDHPHRRLPLSCSQLCCHEIANGPLRDKALDKPYAILVLCWHCNGEEMEDSAKWPEARQLALLQAEAPEDYDLVAYNFLVNPRAPNRITQGEVDAYRDGDC